MICEPEANVPEDNTVVLAKPAEPVDYVDQYNRNVLGIREVNWGMIGLVALHCCGGLWRRRIRGDEKRLAGRDL